MNDRVKSQEFEGPKNAQVPRDRENGIHLDTWAECVNGLTTMVTKDRVKLKIGWYVIRYGRLI